MKPLDSYRKRRNWMVWLLVIPIFLVLFYYGKFDVTEVDNAMVYGGFYYGMLFLWYFVENEGKYQSPQLLTSAGHMSLNRPPIIDGMWAIFYDGIKAPYLNIDIKSSCVIVPRTLVKKLGEYYVVSAIINKVSYLELSRDAYNCLASHGIRINNLWFGIKGFDFQIDTNKFIGELEEEMKQLNDRANRNVNYAKFNLSDLSGTAADITGPLKDLAPGKKSILQSIKDSMKPTNKDED